MYPDKSVLITSLLNWRDAMLRLGHPLEDIEQVMADVLNGEENEPKEQEDGM